MAIWRVLVSTPRDTNESRLIVSRAVRMTNKALDAAKKDLTLKLCGWPDNVLPGPHPESPQRLIEEQLRFDDSDIVIGIFSKQLGTPTPGAPSGSASELRIAHEAWKIQGRPQVMVYFNQEQTSRPGELRIAQEFVRLLEFKEELKERKILFSDYDGDRDLVWQISEHLLERAFGSRLEAAPYLTSAIECHLESTAPDMRSEGLSELMGDLRLRFDFPEDHRGKSLDLDIDVILTVPIIRPKNNAPPRLLIISPEIDPIVLDGRFIDYREASNRIRFERVQVPLHSRTHILIAGVRLLANVNQIASTFTAVPVCATVIVREGSREITVKPSRVEVGRVRKGLRYSIPQLVEGNGHQGVGPARSTSSGCNIPLTFCRLEFCEGFAGAFKTQNQESGEQPGSSIAKLLTRSADCGSRFAVGFSDVPDGVEVWVTNTAQNPEGETVAALVLDCDSNGSGGRWSDESGFTKVSGGYVVWEWLFERDTGDLRSASFGVGLTNPHRLPLKGKIIQSTSLLAPFSITYRASYESQAVPCFVPGYAPLNIPLDVVDES